MSQKSQRIKDVSSFSRLFIGHYCIRWNLCHTFFHWIFLTLSIRENLYPEASAHTLIDCYLPLTMTGHNTPTHRHTTTPLWYGIFSKGTSCWQVANKAIIFWNDRVNYCDHSVPVSSWMLTFFFPCSSSDKDVTHFAFLTPATSLYHYLLFIGTSASLQAYCSFSDTLMWLFLNLEYKKIFEAFGSANKFVVHVLPDFYVPRYRVAGWLLFLWLLWILESKDNRGRDNDETCVCCVIPKVTPLVPASAGISGWSEWLSELLLLLLWKCVAVCFGTGQTCKSVF